MTTAFPGALDSFVNPKGSSSGGTDKLNTPAVIHGTQHQNINDAMAAVETKIGINNSLVTTSIDFLLKNTLSIDPGHKHTAGSIIGMGTVTSVSVASANGFAGIVNDPTTTPSISISTTVTGILIGNGTGVSAASTTGSGSVVLGTSPTIASPSINKLANLTSNGFVKTSGGDGTLSIDTNTYLTGNETITLSGDVSGSGATSITTAIGAGKVTNTMVASGIDAIKIGGGAVNNTEFSFLDGVTSAIQTQIDGKQPLDAGLTALAAFNTNGFVVQQSNNVFVGRSITGTSGFITVSDGAGGSANPSITIAASYAGQTTITTLGTIGAGTWQGSIIGSVYGGTGINNAGTLTYGANNITFTTTGTTGVTLPTTGTLSTLAGAESLLNKKLGSLTTNGFVKTGSGDGTLSIDTNTYLTSSTGVTTATGTANQVLINGTSGSAISGAITLTLPQDIATTSTPQFAKIGLGAAAHATSKFYATDSSSNVLLVETTGTTSQAGLKCSIVGVRAFTFSIRGDADPDGAFSIADETAGAIRMSMNKLGYTGFAGIGESRLHAFEKTSTSSIRGIISEQYLNGTTGGSFVARKTRVSGSSRITINSGDILGDYNSQGYDGTNFIDAGKLRFISTGTIGTGRVPCDAVLFYATDAATSVVTEGLRLTNAGNVGIGTGATVSAKLHSLSTTEQLRLGYDASNYVSETVGSAGAWSLVGTGTNANFTMTPSGTGKMIFKPTTDSTTFFQAQNSAGTAFLTGDSTNRTLTVTGNATGVNKVSLVGTSEACYLLVQNTNAPSGFRMGCQGNGAAQLGTLDSADFNLIAGAANTATVKTGGTFSVGGAGTAGSGATCNIVLTGSSASPSTTPVLGAAAADIVSIAAVDKTAGDRRMYIQSELGGVISIGNDRFNFAAATGIFSIGGTDVLSLTSTTAAFVGKISTYNNIATVSNGVPSEVGKDDLTAQTANKGATTLYAVPASGAGMYRVSCLIVLTTAASVSSTLPNGQVLYTDNETGGAITLDVTPILGVAGTGQTGALTANTVGTTVSGVVVINAKASTNIQYQTVNYASSLAGMAYALHIKLEAL